MAESQTNLAWDVLLDLTAHRGPLHDRLTYAVRAAIRAGRLPYGSALPPSRTLAANLGISRWAVTQAYTQLATEGYVEARTGSATRVRWAPEPASRPAAPPAQLAAAARFDLTPGRADLRGFPRRRWAEAIRTAAVGAPFLQLGYPEPEGTLELRSVVANYLNRCRGAAAEAGSVTICLRATDAMMRICRVLLASGLTHIAMEEPCWVQLRETVRTAGLIPIPIPVDEHGMVVDELAAHSEARAVCVGPAHQFPTGSVLAGHRRAALLRWARMTSGVVIEDDYDAEFRYDRRAVATLQGMEPSRVVLLGSASKTLAPAVGIGWVVTPGQWTAALREAYPAPLAPPVLNQLAFAEFIESGAYDRHLHAARQRFRARRSTLVQALCRRLPQCPVRGAAAGLHLLLDLPEGCDAARVTATAARRGLLIADLDRFRMYPDPASPGLVIGYGNLADGTVAEAAAALADLVSAEIARAGR